jgi:hypothetical protein
MKKEDLHKIAPKLSKIILDKTGFEIPENYFETVEEGVIAELKAKNLPKKIPAEIINLPENYFNSIEDIVIARLKAEAVKNDNEHTILPDDYFDSIEEVVLTKIKSEPKVISLKSNILKFVAPIAIAASLLLIFILNYSTNAVSFDSLAISEIENWIDNGTIDIDASSIASMYPDIELNDDYFSSSISDTEVLEYLYEEDLDELIYEN